MSKMSEDYRGFKIRYTDDHFDVAGYGFYPDLKLNWVGTFPTLEGVRAGIDRWLDPEKTVKRQLERIATFTPISIVYCRNCDFNDLYDGATFVGDPLGCLCDDCYG